MENQVENAADYGTNPIEESAPPTPQRTKIVSNNSCYDEDTRFLGCTSSRLSEEREGSQVNQGFVVSPSSIKKLMLEEIMIFLPVLIVLGGLSQSGKSEFLKNLLWSRDNRVDADNSQLLFSQNLIATSGFSSYFSKSYSVEVSTQSSLYYAFSSGLRYYFRMNNLSMEAITFGGNTDNVFENQALMETATFICDVMRVRYTDKKEAVSQKRVAFENVLHRGISISCLWELTINRTVLRFLECFRGHLYNAYVWLFMDLEQDLDELHLPPDPTNRDHPYAMKWRSRLHYLLRASCLSSSFQSTRVKVCRLFAIHKDLERSVVDAKIKKLKEECKNAAAHYGLLHLIDFDIVPVNASSATSQREAYEFFLQYLHELLPQEVQLSWIFLRLALYQHQQTSSIFMHYGDVRKLANELNVNVDEFLKFFTSFGSILSVALVDDKSEYIILDPAKFLSHLCQLLSTNSITYGLITPSKAKDLLGDEYYKYFDVLVSVGLASKIQISRLHRKFLCELETAENEQFLYYMSVIRRGKPDEESVLTAVQLVSGLKSPAMNMQIAFTNQILQLQPEWVLVPCEQVNVTCFEMKNSTVSVKFVVQADIVEIRMDQTKNCLISDLDDVCVKIVKAMQTIVQLRAKRGGELKYHLRYICTKGPQKDNWKYHILTDVFDFCESCEKRFEATLNVHQHFKIAVEKETAVDDSSSFSFAATGVTADDALMLSKKVKRKEDAIMLSHILGIGEKYHFSCSKTDPVWFIVLNSIMTWREDSADCSKQCLAKLFLKAALASGSAGLAPEQIELLKRLARNLDIETYSAVMQRSTTHGGLA